MKYYFILIRMAIIKKIEYNYVGWDGKKPELLCIVGGKVNGIDTVENSMVVP